MSEPTTEELIGSLHKDNEKDFCHIIPAVADRLQSLTEENERLLSKVMEFDEQRQQQAEEIERLKKEEKLLRFTIKQVQNQERLAFTAFQGQEAQITHLKTLIGEAVKSLELIHDDNKHATEALTKLKGASDA